MGELRGSEELQMDYEVFGKYLRSGEENGRPKYLGPRSEGARPSIAFTKGGDGKPTWWIYDNTGGECFYAEADSTNPPRSGWRKQYGDEDLEVKLEPVSEPNGGSEEHARGDGRAGRDRSR